MQEWIYDHADSLVALVLGAAGAWISIRFRQSQEIARLKALVEEKILPQLEEHGQQSQQIARLETLIERNILAQLEELRQKHAAMERPQGASSQPPRHVDPIPHVPIVEVETQQKSRRKRKPVRKRMQSAPGK